MQRDSKRYLAPFNDTTLRYTLGGIVFGFLFPAFATFIRLHQTGRPFSDIIQIHSADLLLLIIDTAPFFLGLFSYFIGAKQQRLELINYTERLKANTELEYQKALSVESARLASLGEMAGGIAHEINNPLAIIHLLAERSLESIEQTPPNLETVGNALNRIVTTTNRISTIIRVLRQFSRDGSKDKFEVFPLERLVSEVNDLFQERLKKCDVSFEFSAGLKANVLGRYVQLSQVLINLINNSIDAIEKLEEKWIKFNIDESDMCIKLTVTDSGKGIPSDVAKKIMQPFFTTKPVGKGTGLGLSISKQIIEQHNGKFYLNQKVPNTQFVIELPKESN